MSDAPLIKRTNINIDMELLISARELLDTDGISDTVHAALREVVRRERMKSLLAWDFGGLSPQELSEELAQSQRQRVEGAPVREPV